MEGVVTCKLSLLGYDQAWKMSYDRLWFCWDATHGPFLVIFVQIHSNIEGDNDNTPDTDLLHDLRFSPASLFMTHIWRQLLSADSLHSTNWQVFLYIFPSS